jgi:DNA transformation protein and related proteins
VSVSEGDIAFALELFEVLGDLSSRKMVGGLAIYRGGVIFAMLSRDGRLFLKARDGLAEAMAAEGCVQFGADHGRKMPYWTLPEAALENPELASDWARRALAALT